MALASLDLLLSAETQENIERVVKRQSDFLTKIKNHPQVQHARQTGTILAIEFKTDTQSGYFNNLRDRLYRFFLQRGLILRPLGNVVYVLPPYCITDPQLDQVYTALEAALDFEW